MNFAQTYRAASIAVQTINSTPRRLKSALRCRVRLLGLALLICALVIGAMGTASAQTRDEASIRALGDGFAKAFVQKNPEVRASLFAENGTFVTPVGDFSAGASRNGEGLRF